MLKGQKIAILGLQWGDEGKGKVVSYFAKDYDWIVRFSGGPNAGHTVYYGGKRFIHHLLPSFSKDNSSQKLLIGSGVLIDLEVLKEEVESVSKIISNVKDRLYIDKKANLILEYHKIIDELSERLKGNKAIGTTKRGVGPAQADKINRIGVRIEDLENEKLLLEKLEMNIRMKKELWKDEKMDSLDSKKIMDSVLKTAEFFKDNFKSSIDYRDEILNSSVLFEGTQGLLLDIDFGTYPYVTSTSCSSGGISQGTGLANLKLDKIYGVLKAYTTRVGEGPFPTEDKTERGEKLRKVGGEFGATTGRPRRCGWLDLLLLRYAVRYSGVDSLVLTKADILSGIEKIPVCVAYEIDGKRYEDIDDMGLLLTNKIKPIYEYMDGWKDLKDVNFEKYVRFLEDQLGVSIEVVSTGPETNDVFFRV